MPELAVVSFVAPGLLAVAGAMLLVCLMVSRRYCFVGSGRWLLAGLVLLALAAGEPQWKSAPPAAVAVMVDLSSSTRGAVYRERAVLDRRIRSLLGNTKYQTFGFADTISALPQSALLPDLSGQETRFPLSAAGAILLFSDGRFWPPPVASPVFAVVDPALNESVDAAVLKLEIDRDRVKATVRNNGPPRELRWSGAMADDTTPISGDVVRLATASSAGSAGGAGGMITASLAPGDLWPENDSLSIYSPPAEQREKWWVGGGPARGGWRVMPPELLPVDSLWYLNAGILVLDNISANALSSAQHGVIWQYVRDLGGSLLIVGGDHAFAAGGFDGTALDALSPLASSPPSPAAHWVLLADASGSMAAETSGGGTKWKAEAGALAALVQRVPAEDRVSIGGFAESIAWWSTGQSARQTAALPLPPSTALPGGPTNLEAAIRQVIGTSSDLPTELLVLSDAETELSDPDALAAAMLARKCRLHLLALSRGKAFASLQGIAKRTGGSLIEQEDARQWQAAARSLLQAARPSQLERDPVEAKFEMELASLGVRKVETWNRTWQRPRTWRIAVAGESPLGARWQVGAGQVAALAWRAGADDAEQVARMISVPPRDPRFVVKWSLGSGLEITVDAIDQGAFMNGESLSLELFNAAKGRLESGAIAVPQVAPGRYALALPIGSAPLIASVRRADRVLARCAIAGRYAAEFEQVGNDLTNLRDLASRSGGMLIENGARSLAFPTITQDVALAPWFAAMAAAAIGAGLIQGLVLSAARTRAQSKDPAPKSVNR